MRWESLCDKKDSAMKCRLGTRWTMCSLSCCGLGFRDRLLTMSSKLAWNLQFSCLAYCWDYRHVPSLMDPGFYISNYLLVCVHVGPLVLANNCVFCICVYLKEWPMVVKSFPHARNYAKHLDAVSPRNSFLNPAHFVGEDLWLIALSEDITCPNPHS